MENKPIIEIIKFLDQDIILSSGGLHDNTSHGLINHGNGSYSMPEIPLD